MARGRGPEKGRVRTRRGRPTPQREGVAPWLATPVRTRLPADYPPPPKYIHPSLLVARYRDGRDGRQKDPTSASAAPLITASRWCLCRPLVPGIVVVVAHRWHRQLLLLLRSQKLCRPFSIEEGRIGGLGMKGFACHGSWCAWAAWPGEYVQHRQLSHWVRAGEAGLCGQRHQRGCWSVMYCNVCKGGRTPPFGDGQFRLTAFLLPQLPSAPVLNCQNSPFDWFSNR